MKSCIFNTTRLAVFEVDDCTVVVVVMVVVVVVVVEEVNAVDVSVIVFAKFKIKKICMKLKVLKILSMKHEFIS